MSNLKENINFFFEELTMINVALVGCGRIVESHAGNLGTGKIPGACLAAVCDVVRERADGKWRYNSDNLYIQG